MTKRLGYCQFGQRIVVVSLCTLFAAVSAAYAQAAEKAHGYLIPAKTGEGFHFSHHDWEMACDNTRSCSMVGYSPDDETGGIAVQLTREAGSATPISGALIIGNYGDMPALDALPDRPAISMHVNGRFVGHVTLDHLAGKLSKDQIQVLIPALLKNSRIEFSYKNQQLRLSDAGAAAVLLKMDEFQGRIGTPGALARKGTRSEQQVRPPVPLPTVVSAPLPPPRPEDRNFVSQHATALVEELRKSISPDDHCPDLLDTTNAPVLEAIRLSDTQMLLSTRCWLAAYNFGYGYWVVPASPPFILQQTVTLDSSDSEVGGNQVSASHKGRGLGDCWSSDNWTWDGKAFVHTHSSTTGMCRLIEAGGVWELSVWRTKER